MRLPLAVNLESRDGALDPRDDSITYGRDAKVVNGVVEVKGDRAVIRKRPGIVRVGQVTANTGQLIYNWNGIRIISGDTVYSGTIASLTNSPSGTALSPTNTLLQFSAANTGSGAATPRMMFKNRSQAWVMNRTGTVSSVTYGGSMGSETFAVVSLTRSGTTATGTVASDLPFRIGENVTIAGAVETAYNGTFALTGVTAGVYRAERVIPITITRSGTTATATSTEPHGLSTGTYTIAGANDAAYNGSKSITVTTDYTFTYTVTVTPASTTTWNPSDKDNAITLSGGDLTATVSTEASSSNALVRGTIGKDSGKWYWEVTVVSVGSYSSPIGVPTVAIGVAASSVSVESSGIGSASAWSYLSSGAKANGTGGASSYGTWPASTFTNGDVVGVALDMDSKEITFYKNGVSLGVAFTNLTGTVYPFFSGEDNPTFIATGAQATANFGATAFTHSAPAGFTALYSDTPYSPASGSLTVTDPAVSTPATFSYTVAGSPSTPATGTITVQGSGGTVPGIVYLNGYFFVMDTSGRIWNSASEDPTSWGALDYVDAQNDFSRGTGIAASRGYLVAFKEWSTEFFYDAANATGSPLSPVDNGTIQTGCASGWSIASIDDSTFWMSQTKAKGRGVHVLSGLETRKVSTPDVDRILDDLYLGRVYSYCLKVDGHTLYLLTIQDTEVDKDVTLVYDTASDWWYEWTAINVLGSGDISSIARSGNFATATVVSGSMPNDGAGVLIAGANQSEYNGIKQATRLSATEFGFFVSGNPLTPATGTITWRSGYPSGWDFVGAISFGDSVLTLRRFAGLLYTLDDGINFDDVDNVAQPIPFSIRTPRFDGGTLDRKSCAAVTLIGTKVNDRAAIRWSDDDFATATKFRQVDLSDDEPRLRRCGAFKRRAFEIMHVGNSAPIFEALEIDFGK